MVHFFVVVVFDLWLRIKTEMQGSSSVFQSVPALRCGLYYLDPYSYSLPERNIFSDS